MNVRANFEETLQQLLRPLHTILYSMSCILIHLKFRKTFKTCFGDQNRCSCHSPGTKSYRNVLVHLHTSHLYNGNSLTVINESFISRCVGDLYTVSGVQDRCGGWAVGYQYQESAGCAVHTVTSYIIYRAIVL